MSIIQILNLFGNLNIRATEIIGMGIKLFFILLLYKYIYKKIVNIVNIIVITSSHFPVKKYN